MTLSNLIYLDSKVCATLKKLVGDKPAYFVGGYNCADDAKLAVATGFCFAGSNLHKSFDFADDNAVKTMLKQTDVVPTLPGVYHIDENTNVIQIIADQLQTVATKPFRFIIPKHPNSLGLAILNTGESQEIRRCHIAFRSGSDGPNGARKSRTMTPHKFGGGFNPKAALYNAVLKSLNFCFFSVDDKYARKPGSFFDAMTRSRGIIERLPSSSRISIDITGFIDSNGIIIMKRIVECLITMTGSLYAYVYPLTDVDHAEVEDLFYKVAALVAGRQGCGWITVTIEAFDSDNRGEERSILGNGTKTRLNVKSMHRPYQLAVRSVDLHYNALCSFSDLIEMLPRSRSIVIVPNLSIRSEKPVKCHVDSKTGVESIAEVDLNTKLTTLMAKGLYFDAKSMQGAFAIDQAVVSVGVSRSSAITQAIKMIKEPYMKACRHPYQSAIDKSSIIDLLDSVYSQALSNND